MESLGVIGLLLIMIGPFIIWFGNMWQFNDADKIKDLKLTDKEKEEFMKNSNKTEMIGFIIVGLGIILVLIVGLNN